MQDTEKFPIIRTARLALYPSSLEIEKAVLSDGGEVSRLTGFGVAASWPGDDWIDALSGLIDMYEENPGWCRWNRNIVHLEDRRLIGGVGCVLPPADDGSVSIGYYIAPDYRRQGFATEAVFAYVDWLSSLPDVSIIRAECLVKNSPSIRILRRAGLEQVSEFEDEEGRKLSWESRVTCR